jgi:hypothetical protein
MEAINLGITISLLLFAVTVSAQQDVKPKRQKAQKDLTSYLNSLLSASNTIHWAYKDGKMTIDSGFSIDTAGILSVTVRFHHPDSGFYRVRFASPVACLTRAVEDLYYVFEATPEAVGIYETRGWNSESLTLVRKDDLFHLGCPRKNKLYKKFRVDKIQTLLDKVKKYYGS